MTPEDYAVFSMVDGVAGWSLPHWRVEWCDGDPGGFMSHPLAVAYVTEYPEGDRGGPLLDYLIVFDQWRRQGVVAKLVRAIHARWPGIRHTERMDLLGNFR